MKIKLAIFDLDGTLLTDDKEISVSTVMMINKLPDYRIIPVIASGRHLYEIQGFITKYNLSSIQYIISRDGLHLYKGDTELYKGQVLRGTDIKCILNILGIRYCFASNSTFDYMVHTSTVCAIRNLLFKTYKKRQPVWTSIFLSKLLCIQFGKLIVPLNQMNKETVAVLQEQYSICLINNDSYQIMAKDVSKYLSIEYLCKLINIPIGDVLFFGDDYNDLECFEHIPNSVVMGNASKELQKYTFIKTDTNNNDGVAKALDSILFNVQKS